MNFWKRFFSFFLFCGIITSSFVASFSLYANAINQIRVWPSATATRVVVDMVDEAHYTYFTLSHPARLVVDIQDSVVKTHLPIVVSDSPVLKKIRRSAPPDKGTYRLVLELKQHVNVNAFKLPPNPMKKFGNRLVLDLFNGASPTQGMNPLVPHKATSVSAKNVSASVNNAIPSMGNQDIVIAVDPGHGGIDPGSIGPGRHYEKNITISIARKLVAQINAVPGLKAILTRTGDYYVPLNKRSEIARKHKAHLLISIHADAFNSTIPRGASVFVLSTRRANTEIAKWVEDTERQSELLGGAGQVLSHTNNDKNVSQTLLDLQFSHSQKEGYKLAADILAQLGKVTYLHRRHPVNASLAVLKSPDIPSVLIETGFISNPKEEKLLLNQSHQQKIARSVATAVKHYFEQNPPQGTLFANRHKMRQYRVRSGDSLSILAKRYHTQVTTLKRLNHLQSNVLRVGQHLMIPPLGGGASSVEASAGPTKTLTHKVRRGEYLGLIASKYHVSVLQIKKDNHLRSNALRVGQTLSITVHGTHASRLTKHKVKSGEYLSKIAARYHVSLSVLRKVNRLTSDTLRVGQVLVIPN